MKKDFSYGLIPIYQDQDQVEFLVIQHVAGHWAFPKGHSEQGETPLATAQREFEEETGLKNYRVEAEQSFIEEYYPTKDGEVLHKTVTYFPAFVENKGVKIQESEVKDFAWLEYKPALEKITFAGSKKMLKETRKYLRSLLH